ncbi:hypothetical protein NXS19_013582 [Fusarium pseudograminearum]|nr:hypothetical protein NXS19_013582 [Fusarium pseudograminearum]
MFHYRTNLFNPSEIEHIPDCTSQWSSTNQSHSSNSNLNHHSSIIRKLPAFNKGLEQTASNMGGKTSKPLYQGTPGGVKKLTKRRPKETLVKNWQRNLRPNCRSDRRRKRADDTLQRNRDTSVRRGPEQRRGPKPDQVRNHYQDLKK